MNYQEAEDFTKKHGPTVLRWALQTGSVSKPGEPPKSREQKLQRRKELLRAAGIDV